MIIITPTSKPEFNTSFKTHIRYFKFKIETNLFNLIYSHINIVNNLKSVTIFKTN